MAWVLDLGARPGTAAIVRLLRDAEPTLRSVRAPDPRDPIGVIVGDESSSVLTEALRAAAGAQVMVLTDAPGTTGPWMAYPGGFSIDAPTCLPLEVRTAAERTTVRVPLGRPC